MATPVVTLFDGYPQSEGAKIGSVASVIGPSSYTAGGFTLSAVSFGMSQIESVSGGTCDSTGVYIAIPYTISGTNKPSATIKVVVYSTAAGLPLAAGSDLSAVHFTFRVIGI